MAVVHFRGDQLRSLAIMSRMWRTQNSGQRVVQWFCALLLLWGCFSHAAGADGVVDGDQAAARAAVSQFGTALKSALGGALAKDGPVVALEVCAGEAPHLAESVTERSDITVGRISEKTRNPANRPTDWQLEVLYDWQADLARGTDIAGNEYFSVQADGGFRYMRPIMIQPVCLTCHGESLSPELQAALASRYPEDRATGYRVGELRGAFVAHK